MKPNETSGCGPNLPYCCTFRLIVRVIISTICTSVLILGEFTIVSYS